MSAIRSRVTRGTNRSRAERDGDLEEGRRKAARRLCRQDGCPKGWIAGGRVGAAFRCEGVFDRCVGGANALKGVAVAGRASWPRGLVATYSWQRWTWEHVLEKR